jgi:hypothetical protein
MKKAANAGNGRTGPRDAVAAMTAFVVDELGAAAVVIAEVVFAEDLSALEDMVAGNVLSLAVIGPRMANPPVVGRALPPKAARILKGRIEAEKRSEATASDFCTLQHGL